MGDPLISALVPVQGRARLLVGCLEDLCSQTLAAELEILVLGSRVPAGELEIVRSFAQAQPSVHYLPAAQAETSSETLNRGIDRAQGRYLSLAHPGDRHRPDALAHQVEVLERYRRFGIVYADSLLSEVEDDSFASTRSRMRYDWPDFNLATALNACLFGSQPVWRRSAHEDCGRFRGTDPRAVQQGMFLSIAWRHGAVHLRETLGLALRHSDHATGGECHQEGLRELIEMLQGFRRSIPLEDLFPTLKIYDDSPEAEAAAWVEFGNLCALSPYSDLQMALGAYRQAHELANGDPQLRAIVTPVFCNNSAAVLACLDQSEQASAALRQAGDCPEAEFNRQRLAQLQGRPKNPLELSFMQILHPAVLSSRRNQGLQLDSAGKLHWSEDRSIPPWDVYEGPAGVFVDEAEFASCQDQQPRAPLPYVTLRPQEPPPPGPAPTGLPHIMLVMYGWADSGGGTILPRQVAKGLVRAGYRVTVFYAGVETRPELGPYGRAIEEEDGVSLHGVFNRPSTFMDLSDPMREIDDPTIREAFEETLDTSQPDLVHFYNLHNLGMSLVETCRQRRVPTVFSSNNYWAFCPRLYLFDDQLDPCPGPKQADCSSCLGNRSSTRDYAVRLDAARLILGQGFDLHLAVSERVRELYLEHGADPETTRVLQQQPQSVDLLWQRIGRGRPITDRLDRPLRVGYIGSLLPHKGVHLLAAALQAFPDDTVEGLFFGDTPAEYRRHLEQLDSKDRIQFHGAYQMEDMPQLLQQVDVVVVPSIWEDCAPYVVAEAQAARCPVIGADTGGIPEFFDEGQTGLSFPSGDLRALASCLGRFCFEPELLGAMQAAITAPRGFAAYLGDLRQTYRELCAEDTVKSPARASCHR